MACATLTGIPKGCDNNTGGIVRVLINDKDNITSVTESIIDWEVTAITKTAAFVDFNFRRNVGMYTEERQTDLLAGSTFYIQTIMLKLFKREASKSKALNIAGEGQRDLVIIVEDANGKFWYFENMQMTTDTGGSGTVKADGSNYEVTFVNDVLHKAYEVEPTIIAGLLTVGP